MRKVILVTGPQGCGKTKFIKNLTEQYTESAWVKQDRVPELSSGTEVLVIQDATSIDSLSRYIDKPYFKQLSAIDSLREVYAIDIIIESRTLKAEDFPEVLNFSCIDLSVSLFEEELKQVILTPTPTPTDNLFISSCYALQGLLASGYEGTDLIIKSVLYARDLIAELDT